MITKPFGTKVVINPLTVNSFYQNDAIATAIVPPPPTDNNFLLLTGDDFLLLSGTQLDLLLAP
jgi:hypothetical protein